jgi:3-hydroxyisobutyrate dehydrogenase-like beta-hydroxyacid dehydrogenase
MSMKIGFAGLGKMGSGMARNLIRAGHEVAVYNRTPDKAEALAKDGARVAKSAADVAHGAEAVFTMLLDDKTESEVTFGDDGLAAGLSEGAFHISCSTISVAFARTLQEEHGKRGQGYISAAVFGRPQAAESKKLVVVTGGEKAAVERFNPLFDAIGRRTFFAGPEPWNANAVKLCGNFMIASVLETFSEAFTTLRSAKLDHRLFLEIMNELFQSPVYQTYGAVIANRQFDPAGFALKLGLKDIRLVLELAKEMGSPMPLAELVRNNFTDAMEHGQSDLDWSSIELVAARRAGIS